MLHQVIVFLTTLSLSINNINLIPIQYRSEHLFIVNLSSAVNNHEKISNEDREGDFEGWLLLEKLLGKFWVQRFDVLNSDSFTLASQIRDNDFLSVFTFFIFNGLGFRFICFFLWVTLIFILFIVLHLCLSFDDTFLFEQFNLANNDACLLSHVSA